MAKKAGVKNVVPLLATSPNVAEALCQAAEHKEIDMLVCGSRGHGKLAQLFLGSTSKYVTEHAKCNVMVVKREPPAAEEHVDISVIDAAEEAERKRRIEEHAARVAGKADAEHAQLDLHIVKMAEVKQRRSFKGEIF